MNERISSQTQLVLNVLSREFCHLSAEEIQERIPGSSTATVYRALERLVSLGKIRRLELDGRKAIYEYARNPHVHFICTKCNEIVDMPLDLTGIVSEAARCAGHHVLWSDTTARGVCSKCIAAEAQ